MSYAANMGTRLTLDLWYPNCWAIGATEQTEEGGGRTEREEGARHLGLRLRARPGTVAYEDDASELFDNPEVSRLYLGG